MDKKFTWVQTHKELVEWLKDKEDKQQEMIKLLKEAGVDVKDLNAIDPFTFFNFIHKHRKERLNILQKIAKIKGFYYPEDVLGLPTVMGFIARMFEENEKKTEQIKLLWKFFYEILDEAVKEETFSNIRKITGKEDRYAKLTDAMFFVAPKKYLPIDSKTIYYIQNYLGLDYHFETYSEYLKIIEQVHQKDTRPFYVISDYSHHYTVFSKVKDELEPKVFENFLRLLRKLFNDINIQKGIAK